MTQLSFVAVAIFASVCLAFTLYFNSIWSKFVTIAVVFLLANMIYFSLDGVKGWPADADSDLSVKGFLASVVIVTPTDTDEGGIYISVFSTVPKKWYEYVYHRNAPKTLYLKYTDYRASELSKASQALKDGKAVRINGIPSENEENKQEGQSGEEQQGKTGEADKGNSNPDTYTPKVPNLEIIDPQEIFKKKK